MPRPLLRLTLAALALAGCAHVQLSDPPPIAPLAAQGAPAAQVARSLGVSAPSDAALIVLYRSSAYEGRLTTFSLRVDGVADVDMPNGVRAIVAAPPGTVTVRAAGLPNLQNLGVGVVLMDRPVVSFTAEPGEAYFVEASPGIEGGPHLTVQTPEAGLADTPRLRQVRSP